MPEPNEHVQEQVRALLADGRKLEAIKLVREATGRGLLEAKNYVEGLAGGEQPPSSGGDFEQELVALLRQGNRIQAIKHFRQETGAGLKEAHDAMLELAQRHGIQSRAGCLGLVLVALGAGTYLLT